MTAVRGSGAEGAPDREGRPRRGPLLVVFAKRPEPGRVKTRLCPPFTPEEAAGLYAALLEDVLEETSRIGRALGIATCLALDPPDAVAEFAGLLPAGMDLVAQRGDGLSARMEHAAASAFAAGHAPVLLRGSDSPLLGAETVAEALAALREHDLAVCPDLDGGYNLIGLAAPAPGLFDHPMSTARVLEDTLARARAAGLRARVLPAGFDVDTVDDLVHLRAASAPGAGQRARRTLAWLAAHGR